MLQPILHIAIESCRRPHWHPDGRLLSVSKGGAGLVLDIDRASFDSREGYLRWSPDGHSALERLSSDLTAVRSWPETNGHPSFLPCHDWQWLGSKLLGRIARTELIALPLDESEAQPYVLAKALPGERWIRLHGFSDGSWAALRWDPENKQMGLSTGRGGNWPVEHLRRPDLEGIVARQWSWASQGDAWILGDRSAKTIMGWTFPQGQEWLQKSARVSAVCHVDTGAVWAEDNGVVYWDAATQEIAYWDSPTKIFGLAWNPVRRLVAVIMDEGIELLQLIPS